MNTKIITLLVAPYRVKRETPRVIGGDGLGGERRIWEDPAPPWVAMLAARMVERFGVDNLTIMQQALGWCAAGEPVSRTTQLLGLIQCWRGAHCVDIVSSFLMQNKHGGRPRGAAIRRPGLPYVPESWEEVDELAALGKECLSDEMIEGLASGASPASDWVQTMAKEIQFTRAKRRSRITRPC